MTLVQTAPAHVLADRQVDVETPEHVAIGYELADLGSRFTALLLDALILMGSVFGFGIVASLILSAIGAENVVGGLGMGVVTILIFLMVWGYFIFFEGLRDGQTPGKKRMGIRVVHDGGYPVTVRAAAVRTFIKVIVDIQPGGSCIFGGLSMMLHPQTKRIGDLAAGTVVVRDRTGHAIPEESTAPAGPALGPPRMSTEEFTAVSMYVQRRLSLDGSVRAELSRKLMARVERHVMEDARRTAMSPDAYLSLLHQEETERRRAAGAGGRAGTAQATALVRRQRAEWAEYQKTLDETRRMGLDTLDEGRVSRFATLYRGVAADLARARTYGGSPELLYSLERMVGTGHNLFYRPPQRTWRRFRDFAGGGFAALARRLWKPIAIASVLFYLPALLCFAAIRARPEMARELVPAEMMARAENAAAKEARGEGYVEVPQIFMPVMATRLISNNVQVTFLAFAGGVLASLGSAYVLIMNGVLLGTVAAMFANVGQSLHLWTFVLPHGGIELTAICIAGGAGLWMGSGILLPGRRTRREVLVTRGREAVALIMGTAMMLVIAGMIEGFISPSDLPREAKLALAAVFASAMVAYFALAGRGEAAVAAAELAGER
ncbi:stage II sporulation protein M [Longimicrobium terrae]|uniref:Putative membrane protein SpoIIM required for sporulation/putative RDD family membrane protein YckC n=1 Tax=Longimicrobium terrae TaxID=1639882 RepID=A0A841GY41_9BACT|nr:stage II sporulation protein M [Longimicrobium terrae]MBB4636263.1 putative membrane protein SpoIIM required for sporulation/putative RDD family membrane protein YckC [Longimicrobium terrae]MBB6070658.1 putative membrane protein SpoIIM required for sporulation/putative RDD family membrane protein YckC [Longimicrobium terrae]NNC29641.1 hypothetical protein [Longimicrobium terrae]